MKKILIIEDEKTLSDVLKNKLTSEGFEVALAGDGQEGLTKIKEFEPDLILLDIMMPKLDGYQVLEKIKEDTTMPKVPVVIISNSGQPVEIDRALQLGAKDYLVKAQFTPEEVMEKVKKFLGGENESKATQGNGSGGKNLLIIEDDEFLRNLASRKISSSGYKVTTAADGEQAQEILKEQTPDIILLDIMLPGINGFDLLKQIRENDKLKNVPVILLSNLGQQNDIDKGKKLGATDFMVKANFTLDEIIAKLKKYT